MNSLIIVLLAIATTTYAFPQSYGYSNYFSGGVDPKQYNKGPARWRPDCKIVWVGEKKEKEVCKPVKKTVTECNYIDKTLCDDEWECVDYNPPPNVDDCINKKWFPTDENCLTFKEEQCEDKQEYVDECV